MKSRPNVVVEREDAVCEGVEREHPFVVVGCVGDCLEYLPLNQPLKVGGDLADS